MIQIDLEAGIRAGFSHGDGSDRISWFDYREGYEFGGAAANMIEHLEDYHLLDDVPSHVALRIKGFVTEVLEPEAEAYLCKEGATK